MEIHAPAIAQQQITSNSLHDLLKAVTMNVSRQNVVIGPPRDQRDQARSFSERMSLRMTQAQLTVFIRRTDLCEE